ncbi:DUF881 domain-containing protein [Dermabacteraceae bacterium TAE3-ERU27]|nr:DUF881 domain-containing protein [Dermabacteraceae bacterium TAE3-ERU27]
MSRRNFTRAAATGTVMLASGLLFSTSARLSRGSNLRNDSGQITDLLHQQDEDASKLTKEITARRARIEELTNQQRGQADPRLKQQLASSEAAAGMSEVSGPGLVVTLTDAPTSALTTVPNVQPNDLVVHQQDLEGYINALWSGGAEAMMLQDQRVIATSAFRCVGNTLLLQGRVYSPPFKVSVIGPVEAMLAALEASAPVSNYRKWVNYVGLGESIERKNRIALPAYTGAVTLTSVKGL